MGKARNKALSSAETITGDNAGNNGTLCDSLHDQPLKKYDNDDDRFRILEPNQPLKKLTHLCKSDWGYGQGKE
jgi:hypothetical protein